MRAKNDSANSINAAENDWTDLQFSVSQALYHGTLDIFHGQPQISYKGYDLDVWNTTVFKEGLLKSIISVRRPIFHGPHETVFNWMVGYGCPTHSCIWENVAEILYQYLTLTYISWVTNFAQFLTNNKN